MLLLATSLGAAPTPLDSQLVLTRFAMHLNAASPPKNSIFTYTISQAGPVAIEQMHRIYRSGIQVRDETLAVDGQGLHAANRVIRIGKYRDRYTIESLAPRPAEYTFLFEEGRRVAGHVDYLYQAIPLIKGAPFIVEGMTIDGNTFLPSLLRFRISARGARGSGDIRFAKFGRYWMPTVVTITAIVNKKPSRERIVFSGYRFPASLPKATFRSPKPLPVPVLPNF
ncbi:MAG: hypothetical protein M3Z07_00170 [Candidatus Eremiobacteraeota bacterium]|nr:hypothetical protein [Candidatus Eremiobacteraeota bacterium]